jgi:hypothetical protein
MVEPDFNGVRIVWILALYHLHGPAANERSLDKTVVFVVKVKTGLRIVVVNSSHKRAGLIYDPALKVVSIFDSLDGGIQKHRHRPIDLCLTRFSVFS